MNLRVTLPFTSIMLLILVLAITSQASVQREAKPQHDDLPEHLLSGDEATREAAVQGALKNRSALIQEWIRVVEKKDLPFESRAAAAYLLGEYRADESAPVLLQALHDDLIINELKPSREEGRYQQPFTDALRKLGPAVIGPSMAMLTESGDETAMRVSVSTLMFANPRDGHTKSFVLAILKDHLKKEENADSRKAIQNAIDYVSDAFSDHQ